MEKMILDKPNFDSDFNLRFELENGKLLQYIPKAIYAVQLPELGSEIFEIFEEKSLNSELLLTLRSFRGELVEEEIFQTLYRTKFNISISLSDIKKDVWVYKGCYVKKVCFTPLIKKKKDDKPFNLLLKIAVQQIQFNSINSTNQPFVFGEIDTDNKEGDNPNE